MTEQQRLLFYNPPEEVYRHWDRIQKGYTIASESPNEDNPYYYLDLYPWEVIKDKLRYPPLSGADIYDWLIQEAFRCTKSRVRSKHLYRGEAAMKDWPLRNYKNLSSSQTAKYESWSSQKCEYILHRDHIHESRDVFTRNGYGVYFRKRSFELGKLLVQEKTRQISAEWKLLLPDKKSTYGRKNHSLRARAYKEYILEQQTSLVMDYIFKYGTVENFFGDWRSWRKKIEGNLFYLERMYFPVIVSCDRDFCVTFLDKMPESILEVFESPL